MKFSFEEFRSNSMNNLVELLYIQRIFLISALLLSTKGFATHFNQILNISSKSLNEFFFLLPSAHFKIAAFKSEPCYFKSLTFRDDCYSWQFFLSQKIFARFFFHLNKNGRLHACSEVCSFTFCLSFTYLQFLFVNVLSAKLCFSRLLWR